MVVVEDLEDRLMPPRTRESHCSFPRWQVEEEDEEEEREEEREEGTWLRAAAGTNCIHSRTRLTPASQGAYFLPPSFLPIIVDVDVGLCAVGIERGLASCVRLEAGRWTEQGQWVDQQAATVAVVVVPSSMEPL